MLNRWNFLKTGFYEGIKLHRLVSLGCLHSSKDPRDERVTLLRLEELESFFMFPMEEGPDHGL